jgi:hypothetical protein
VSSDRGAPPRLSEAELPAVTPLEFIVTRDNGRPGLDVREGEFEQVYSVDDMYSRLLFIALCRQEGATVYRKPSAKGVQSEDCRRKSRVLAARLLFDKDNPGGRTLEADSCAEGVVGTCNPRST